MLLTPAASIAGKAATERRKVKATPRTATNISLGHLWRQHTLQLDSTLKQNDFMSAKRQKEARLWQPRRWPTNWRVLVITY
jgi:hypothetical protein